MKPNLLLLHGALGSKEHFNSIIPALEDDYQIHTLNFEGHGGRSSHRAFSITAFSENLLSYTEENDLEDIVVFGYSMGGYVALYTSLINPELIHKIITLGTKFNWSPATAEKEVRMLNPTVIQEKVPQFAHRLAELHGHEHWKSVLQKTAAMMIDLGSRPLLSKKQLSKINLEITIGRGKLDRMVSQEESQWAADYLPLATHVTLDDVKHPIEQIKPQIIIDYIKGHCK